MSNPLSSILKDIKKPDQIKLMKKRNTSWNQWKPIVKLLLIFTWKTRVRITNKRNLNNMLCIHVTNHL